MLHPKQPAASVRATRDRVEDLSIDEHHEESTRAAEAGRWKEQARRPIYPKTIQNLVGTFWEDLGSVPTQQEARTDGTFGEPSRQKARESGDTQCMCGLFGAAVWRPGWGAAQ